MFIENTVFMSILDLFKERNDKKNNLFFELNKV